jgi:hypothetical protein
VLKGFDDGIRAFGAYIFLDGTKTEGTCVIQHSTCVITNAGSEFGGWLQLVNSTAHLEEFDIQSNLSIAVSYVTAINVTVNGSLNIGQGNIILQRRSNLDSALPLSSGMIIDEDGGVIIGNHLVVEKNIAANDLDVENIVCTGIDVGNGFTGSFSTRDGDGHVVDTITVESGIITDIS